jgi:hypothetical protein
VTAVVLLQYAIPAGQVYSAWNEMPPGTTTTHGSTTPMCHNHTLIVDNRRLIEISFNHRRAFVDTADVLVLR